MTGSSSHLVVLDGEGHGLDLGVVLQAILRVVIHAVSAKLHGEGGAKAERMVRSMCTARQGGHHYGQDAVEFVGLCRRSKGLLQGPGMRWTCKVV